METGKIAQDSDSKGRWKQFGRFLLHTKLSWGWIILTLAITIAYYSVVSKLPGSTAGLYAGNFSTASIMGVGDQLQQSAGIADRGFGLYAAGKRPFCPFGPPGHLAKDDGNRKPIL